jgi:hypothetical protein
MVFYTYIGKEFRRLFILPTCQGHEGMLDMKHELKINMGMLYMKYEFNTIIFERLICESTPFS